MNIKAIFFIFLIVVQFLSACTSPAVSPTPTPMAMVTATIDPFQNARIVQAFWDALEAGDLETAMAYVDENASCAGYCYFTGKTAFRNYLQGYLEAGFSTKISDVKTIGAIVTYSWAVYRNGNFVSSGQSDEMMQVENGRITFWENQHR